jgi:hypothetical protein
MSYRFNRRFVSQGFTKPSARGRNRLRTAAGAAAQVCGGLLLIKRAEALDLLREGCRKGLIDRNLEDGWPKRIWAVHQGVVLEAQHDKSPPGSYHGYPLQADDNFKRYVLNRWNGRL